MGPNKRSPKQVTTEVHRRPSGKCQRCDKKLIGEARYFNIWCSGRCKQAAYRERLQKRNNTKQTKRPKTTSVKRAKQPRKAAAKAKAKAHR